MKAATRLLKRYERDNGEIIVVGARSEPDRPEWQLLFYAERGRPLEFLGACWEDGEPIECVDIRRTNIYQTARRFALRESRRPSAEAA